MPKYRISYTLVAFLIAAALFLDSCSKKKAVEEVAQKYLFVWAGDQARQAADFLAVVNFDPASADYGKVITTVSLPNPGHAGNEPHHVGLSGDGKILACGGLLSVLKGQKEVFFFDVSNPTQPQFVSSADPAQSSITDEFYSLSNGGFLVTMMGGAAGHHPGRVVEFDQQMNLVAEHPQNPPDDGFNPHGISVNVGANLMVTSDFICPATTLHAVEGDMGLRGSIRVWDFAKREITNTIKIGEGSAGTIDIRLIPGDSQLRGYTAGMTDDKLYLFDTKAGTSKAVFDFATIQSGGWPQLMRITNNGKRLFVSMNMADKVVMFDTSDPEQPQVLKVLDLGKGAGPHYIALTGDEKRLVITDYFLNEDDFGKVHAEGDHRVHVAIVSENDLVLDPKFNLDFDSVVPTGPARPHGVAFK
jgi:selenium-binding protein 1